MSIKLSPLKITIEIKTFRNVTYIFVYLRGIDVLNVPQLFYYHLQSFDPIFHQINTIFTILRTVFKD